MMPAERPVCAFTTAVRESNPSTREDAIPVHVEKSEQFIPSRKSLKCKPRRFVTFRYILSNESTGSGNTALHAAACFCASCWTKVQPQLQPRYFSRNMLSSPAKGLEARASQLSCLPTQPTLVSHLRYASQAIQIRSQGLQPGGYRPFKVIQGNTITLAHFDEPYMQTYGKLMETRFYEHEHESKMQPKRNTPTSLNGEATRPTSNAKKNGREKRHIRKG